MGVDRPEPTSHFYRSQRLKLHYVDWGNPDAPTLLLVHGGRDHSRNWDWVAAAFRDHFHVIAVDLRGHGNSDWTTGGGYSLLDNACDLDTLLADMPFTPLSIMAHSLGGLVSLIYTAAHPDKVQRLVLIDAIIEAAQGAPPGQDEVMVTRNKHLRELSDRPLRSYASVEEAAQRLRNELPLLSAEQAHHLTFHGVKRNPDGTVSWKYDPSPRAWWFYRFLLPEDGPMLSRVACPTLFVRGTKSWTEDQLENGTPDRFRDARFVRFDGAGHWLHHERLDEFLALAKPFLLG